MSKLRQAIGPVYLFACILMGGSAQGMFTNLALQLVAILILAWAFLTNSPAKASRPARQLAWIATLAIALIVIQLIPLPPAIWANIPGRGFVVTGFRFLGQPLGWMPLSLTPADTIATAMALLPPLALLALILRLNAYRDDHMLLAMLLAAAISVALGVFQLSGNGMEHYLYPYNSWNTASGLFANVNHMATLLLVSIPFLVALAARRWREAQSPNDRLLTATMAGAMAVVLGLGVAINHSSALLIIGAPVLCGAALLLVPAGRIRLGRVSAVLALLFLTGVAALAIVIMSGKSASSSTSVTIRADIWSHTIKAIADHGLLGSGVGSFPKVYPLYENPATVDRTYINHAHDDYLEIALETGVAGIILMALFLAWWTKRAFDIWRSPDADEIARAACIASAAILLHSLVDYPLRTAAIAAGMALATALMAEPAKRRLQARPAELRPARHLTL